MLSNKHYKIFKCFVIVELLSLCEFSTSLLLLFQKSLMLCIVYWKINILRYLCPLLFPRQKILVVLFRNDDQTGEVKGEKRTSENRRKINGLKLQKTETNGNFLSWNFFHDNRNFQTILCLLEYLLYRKNSTVAPVSTTCFKIMRFFNKCSTLR